MSKDHEVSGTAVDWALSQKVERSSAKFILVALANCSTAAGGSSPSIDEICSATGQNRKTVMNGIRWLVEKGFLCKERANTGRPGRAYQYQIRYY